MKVLIRKTVLWIFAFIITIGAMIIQRITSYNFPRHLTIETVNENYKIKLPRSHHGQNDCPIELALPIEYSGSVIYREYPSRDTWDTINFFRNNNTLLAFLPAGSHPGQLEYHIALYHNDTAVAIPLDNNIVITFRNSIPNWALASWFIVIILAMLWSIATGLQALYDINSFRKNNLITLILIFLGGVILGAIVQKYATGGLWTGWPLGDEIYEIKVVASALIWLFVFLFNRNKERRWFVVFASVFVLIMYLIPYLPKGTSI